MSIVGRIARHVPYVRKPLIEKDRLTHEVRRLTSWAEDLETECSLLQSQIIAGLQEARTTLLEHHAHVSQDLKEVRSFQVSNSSLMAKNITAAVSRLEGELRSVREHSSDGSTDSHARYLYLDLLEAALTGTVWGDAAVDWWSGGAYDPLRRAVGGDWPAQALTMIGTARMRNLRMLIQEALSEGISGDLIETGAWRGGAGIYMRGVLAAAGDTSRRVFVADSFQGLPEPDPERYPADAGDSHHTHTALAVPREEVEDNFRRFGLWDDQVVIIEGWFRDTLPVAPIDELAVLRMDGDMYESTIVTLESLYDKVADGGFVIVDDYDLPSCARAVDDFRSQNGIAEPLQEIDGAGVWWRVGRPAV